MIMKLKTIFSQFSPDFVLFLPLTLIALFIKVSWLFFRKKTNWLPTRTFLLTTSFKQWVINTIFQQTKPKRAPWIAPISTVFVLIFSINLLGLLPYAFTATSHISLTYRLGIPLWMSINILGFYLSFNTRLSHLVPQGTPPFLIPIMIIIETLSLFVQPIALGLRLAANLTAGHLLIYLLSTAIWTLLDKTGIARITFIIFILLFLLEIGVACIQAYVFTSLIHFYLIQNL